MNDSFLSKNIVCFGDSLTLGYQSPTPRWPIVENIPYGTYLQKWVGSRGCVLVKGVCGETTRDMLLRFQEDVLKPQPHVVIILGGTNDLSVEIPTSEIVNNLRLFYEQAQLQDIMPVAVTVPSLCDEMWANQHTGGENSEIEISPLLKHAIALRVDLNQSIRTLSNEMHFPVVDWFAETCDPRTQALAPEYSNDGCHLTTAGYRKLAEMIWSQVLEERL